MANNSIRELLRDVITQCDAALGTEGQRVQRTNEFWRQTVESIRKSASDYADNFYIDYLGDEDEDDADMDLSKYAPDVVAELRAQYVGNECDTDEYRETQPEKAREMIADLRTYLTTTEERVEVEALADRWEAAVEGLNACGHYEGAEEAASLYGKYFDVLWRIGRHPYFNTVEEIDEWLKDCDEGFA